MYLADCMPLNHVNITGIKLRVKNSVMLHALTLNFLSFYLCKSYSLMYFKGVFFSYLALTFMLKVQNASNQAMELGKHMYFYKNTLPYCKNVTERNAKVCSFFPQLKRMQTCTTKGEGRGNEQTNRKTIWFYKFQKGTKYAMVYSYSSSSLSLSPFGLRKIHSSSTWTSEVRSDSWEICCGTRGGDDTQPCAPMTLLPVSTPEAETKRRYSIRDSCLLWMKVCHLAGTEFSGGGASVVSLPSRGKHKPLNMRFSFTNTYSTSFEGNTYFPTILSIVSCLNRFSSTNPVKCQHKLLFFSFFFF